jgi:predicted nucleotidyltransferase component of viral defense system
MNKNQRDNWKFEVLAEILSALAKNPEIRENLIFKGALILNRHLNTKRKSLDIDSNLDSDFALQHPGREIQKEFLEKHVKQAITRHFEAQNPVRFELNSLRIDLSPKKNHPRKWNAFAIFISLIDHSNAGVRGLPMLTMDVAAPEKLSESSISEMEVDNVKIRVYSLERIAGEKARAFLSTLPTYRAKVKKPGEAIRVKDLYDLTKILQAKPIATELFWITAGNEFRLACETRFVDCTGTGSLLEGWSETKEIYQKDPTIPKDLTFDEVERSVVSIFSFWREIEIIPFSFPLKDTSSIP